MRQLLVSLKKELLLLVNDKIGLLLMFLMPVLLVFIITIVQDSAFRIVNDNRFDILIVNHDRGFAGKSLIHLLNESRSFNVEVDNLLEKSSLSKVTIQRNKLIGIYIPDDFSKIYNQNAGNISNEVLTEFGIQEENKHLEKSGTLPDITVYYDPVLQENFRLSLQRSFQSMLVGLEHQTMIARLFKDMGYDKVPDKIEKKLFSQKSMVEMYPASENHTDRVPNSTQHNVPAWSVFAMFFMVISLGGNIVNERNSGSFVRLRTIPGAFLMTLLSKVVLYIFVAVIQLVLLFSIGMFIFPVIGLPGLDFPDHFIQLFLMILLSALAAISYALMIGTIANTQEQSNGFGAVSIIIFAAIGGIWVPYFVMPDYLQQIGKISPLHWSLEGFYTILLKDGSWMELSGAIFYLILFTFACQIVTFLKLRTQHFL